MQRYIFISLFIFFICGVTSAQYLPEVDSLLKARVHIHYEEENNLPLNQFFRNVYKRYGAKVFQQQVSTILASPTISIDNKILFSHMLQPLMLQTNGESDSLLSHYVVLLRNAYASAEDKCNAFRLLQAATGLYNMEKKYVQAKELYDYIHKELTRNSCAAMFIAYHIGISRSIYMPLGNNAKATEHYLKALHVLDSLTEANVPISPFYKYNVYNDIANVNYHVGNYRDAIANWEKALFIIHAEQKWTNSITGIYNNIGLCYRKLKQYNKAREYFKECITRAEETGDEAWVGIATGNLGGVFAEEGKHEEAILLLQKDIRLSKQTFQYGSVTNAYAKIGQCYAALNNYPKSKAYYDSAIQSFARWPKPISFGTYTYNSLAELYRNYGTLEFKHGQYREAYEYNLQAGIYDDSLKRMQKSQEISLQQNYHAFEKQETENKLLKAKVRAQQLRESVIIVLIVFSVAVLVSVLIIYRLRLRKAKAEFAAAEAAKQMEAERSLRLEEELKSAEAINVLQQKQAEERLALRARELSSITVQIQQKNEVMVGLKTQLEKIAQKESALQDEFKTLYKSVRKDLNITSDWEKFKVHFEQVHPDYFTKLNNACPDLSLSDLRICAYLRMNMDNNSIAHILNVSSDSLRVRRHRLRKRMGFSSDKDIYNYLVSL